MNRFLLAASLFILTACAEAAGPDLTVVGGYELAGRNDPDVTAAADYAISRAPAGYRLRGVAQAHRQIVNGTNYELCLKVRPPQHDGRFWRSSLVIAKVHKGLDNRFDLLEWRDAQTCG